MDLHSTTTAAAAGQQPEPSTHTTESVVQSTELVNLANIFDSIEDIDLYIQFLGQAQQSEDVLSTLNKHTQKSINTFPDTIRKTIAEECHKFIVKNGLQQDFPICPCQVYKEYDYQANPESHIGVPVFNIYQRVVAHLIWKDNTSNNYKQICDEFIKHDLVVHGIAECINVNTYLKFKAKCAEMEEDGVSPNITSLYHCTRAKDVDSIYAQGLDHRLANAGYFGAGIYGAQNPLKADMYYEAESLESLRFTLQVDTALGNVRQFPDKQFDKTIRRAPPMFNSVSGNVLFFPEFAVYEREQTYIRNIIFYKYNLEVPADAMFYKIKAYQASRTNPAITQVHPNQGWGNIATINNTGFATLSQTSSTSSSSSSSTTSTTTPPATQPMPSVVVVKPPKQGGGTLATRASPRVHIRTQSGLALKKK